MINNGNRTEWSPIRFVIIQVKSDDRAARVRFVHREYDFGQNLTTQTESFYQSIVTITNSDENNQP